jgi:hypothetical protein
MQFVLADSDTFCFSEKLNREKRELVLILFYLYRIYKLKKARHFCMMWSVTQWSAKVLFYNLLGTVKLIAHFHKN